MTERPPKSSVLPKRLAFLLLTGLLVTGSCAQETPHPPLAERWQRERALSPDLPRELVLSPDWYPFSRRGPHGRPSPRWRTNHTLATVGLRFRGTRRIGLRFASDFFNVPGLQAGFLAWTLTSPGETARGAARHPLTRPLFAEDLDPLRTYSLAVEIRFLLDPDTPPAALRRIERFRDEGGRQGAFADLVGVVRDADCEFLPPEAPPSPWLDYIVYGDSLADGGILEPDGGPEGVKAFHVNPLGAAAGWPRKAIRLACKLLKHPRTPRGINHSFGGWWGCHLEFPYKGVANARLLRKELPWLPPDFASVVNRSHPTAPPFATKHMDLVIYALAQNDMGTGRLKKPGAYVRDIQENIRLLRRTWPGAKILVVPTHVVEREGGRIQQSLMRLALMSGDTDHRRASDLHLVSLTKILFEHGKLPQKTHPPQAVHDLWALSLAPEIAKLLENETTEDER